MARHHINLIVLRYSEIGAFVRGCKGKFANRLGEPPVVISGGLATETQDGRGGAYIIYTLASVFEPEGVFFSLVPSPAAVD